MVDIEHARLAAETDPLDEGEYELPVHVIEAEARFVEEQEWWVLHHGACDQPEALVAEREPVERLVGSVGHAEQGEPLVGDGLLGVGAFRVEPDAVVEAGDDDVPEAGAHRVLPLEGGRDVPDELLDLPDALAGAALVAEDIDVVDIALRMIAGDQLQQAGLAAAVGAAQLPALVRFDRPVEALEHGVVGVADGGAGELHERRVGVERWQLRRWVVRRDLEIARLEMKELVELVVGLLVGSLDAEWKSAVVDVGDVGDEVGALVEAVEHDHHGGRLGQRA